MARPLRIEFLGTVYHAETLHTLTNFVFVKVANMDRQDFILCSCVCDKITNRYGGHTLADEVPEAERNVILIWTVSGIIENGGFRYLFGSTLPGDPNYGLTIDAFERIGCYKAADVIKKAVCLFSNCEPPSKKGQRIKWLEKQPQEIRDALDTAFWNELDIITTSLADYIRRNSLDNLCDVS